MNEERYATLERSERLQVVFTWNDLNLTLERLVAELPLREPSPVRARA